MYYRAPPSPILADEVESESSWYGYAGSYKQSPVLRVCDDADAGDTQTAASKLYESMAGDCSTTSLELWVKRPNGQVFPKAVVAMAFNSYSNGTLDSKGPLERALEEDELFFERTPSFSICNLVTTRSRRPAECTSRLQLLRVMLTSAWKT